MRIELIRDPVSRTNSVAFTDTLACGQEYGLLVMLDDPGAVTLDDLDSDLIKWAQRGIDEWRRENATRIEDMDWSWE